MGRKSFRFDGTSRLDLHSEYGRGSYNVRGIA